MSVLPLQLKGTVESRSDVVAQLERAGDAVLVLRGRPRLLVIRCPCGCGEIVSINLDRLAGKAWRYYEKNGLVTIFPSVWRDSGCESHFIVSKSRIFVFGKRSDETDQQWDESWVSKDMPNADDILQALSGDTLEDVAKIADRIDALPWDVLRICRRLVADGRVIEGDGALKGHFRRT